MKALLVIDMLVDFINEEGALNVGPAGQKIILFVKDKIEDFRKKGYPIIFICDNHEKDDKEFDMFPAHCIAGTKGAQIIEELDVKDGDKIIRKALQRLFGTELDLYLRKGVDELFIVVYAQHLCAVYRCRCTNLLKGKYL